VGKKTNEYENRHGKTTRSRKPSLYFISRNRSNLTKFLQRSMAKDIELSGKKQIRRINILAVLAGWHLEVIRCIEVCILAIASGVAPFISSIVSFYVSRKRANRKGNKGELCEVPLTNGYMSNCHSAGT
jgi:hypothetical protein